MIHMILFNHPGRTRFAGFATRHFSRWRIRFGILLLGFIGSVALGWWDAMGGFGALVLLVGAESVVYRPTVAERAAREAKKRGCAR